MVDNIVEISENGLHLSLFRGFLRVMDAENERGRVVLDDIVALVLSAQQVSISKNIMVALAEHNAPIIVCGKNWHPISICANIAGHHQSAGVLYNQIDASAALRKRLWQKIIKTKITHQALILKHYCGETGDVSALEKMVKHVRSGDPDNREAQAAKIYWRALMGNDFRRDFNASNQNSLLNYGYTVLRAATARAVVATGLHPALGVYHSNKNNPYCLVDDLMEPFRPLVDDIVYKIWTSYNGKIETITPEIKKELTGILSIEMIGDRGATLLINALSRTAQSLKTSFETKTPCLVFPEVRPQGQLL